DPAVPCIEERAVDATWTTNSRLAFARSAARALTEMHAVGTDDEPIIHRNLTPRTILVKHDNSPILTGFEHTKIPSQMSVASPGLPAGTYAATIAPEVRAQGLAAADHRSDLYSICACMSILFQGRDDHLSRRAVAIFSHGLAEEPDQRGALRDLDAA